MAKRISISLPDEMFFKLAELKDELSDRKINDRKVTRTISGICQEALKKVIIEAEVSRVYRLAGIEDGREAAKSLSEKDKNFIVKVLGGDGPYKKWSRFEKVSVLNDHFGNARGYNFLMPKFMDLMDGKIVLDMWVEKDPGKAEDRRGNMCWSYIEGCFEGIVMAATLNNQQ